MGNRTDRISDLEWEVQKLTEIKDKFKARAKQLKSQLDSKERDNVKISGLRLPQVTNRGDVVDTLFIEFESNYTGDFHSVIIDPYSFINWIGDKEIDSIKKFIKSKIDKL